MMTVVDDDRCVVPRFKFINLDNINAYLDNPTDTGIDDGMALLDQLLASLQVMQRRDAKAVEDALDEGLSLANSIPAEGDEVEREDRARFELLQFCGQKAKVPILFALSTLMSSKGGQDIKAVNPYCADPAHVQEVLGAMMLYTMRVGQANRLIASILSMKDSLTKIKTGVFDRNDMKDKVMHASSGLAGQLSTQRCCFTKRADGVNVIDPRFLIFEFSFGYNLRKRQVEMCNSFIGKAAIDESSCQQMIMGAGKTSVIGPLVALCLADSTRLVTLTMPSNLLELSRSELRNRFGAVLPKRVYTFEFDRGWDNSTSGAKALRRLLRKLNSVKARRGILVSKPECLKSLMLKFVEQVKNRGSLS